MSKKGLEAAAEYGVSLPEFSNLKEAKQAYFTYRDEILEYIDYISQGHPFFKMDYTAESLKSLEKWYFELFDRNEFDKQEIKRNEFERLMTIYYGDMIVRNLEGAEWVVEEFIFDPGTYLIGIKKGNGTLFLGDGCLDHYNRPDKKRRNYYFRKYNCSYKSGLV